ncbi:MAG: hypothetical protein KFF73_12010, partial [Cyclobacteriaceae bacterium]|nr:hypothetical protein [Cyclobacteriaceae bacterium]
MQVEWESLKGLGYKGIDLWLLIPSGLGANPLLKKDGKISTAWMNKLEKHLGISEEEIKKKFYRKVVHQTLFGDLELEHKTENAIEGIADLFKAKLNKVFNYVSNPLPLKDNGRILFHFIFASQNANACKIADDIL